MDSTARRGQRRSEAIIRQVSSAVFLASFFEGFVFFFKKIEPTSRFHGKLVVHQVDLCLLSAPLDSDLGTIPDPAPEGADHFNDDLNCFAHPVQRWS